MSSFKFDQMFKFISQYKYEINKIVPDNLKCGKCQKILINAYCVPCGCLYCYECVNEMLNNGVENCPGKTDDCKDELISNNHIDFRVNKKISNVVIKCPEEMCVYECAIINMEEHTRVCEKKSVKCPFANLGCDEKKIAREMLNDHCQTANFNHCKILIEVIDNMRNEIDILKINNENNQLKIENLEKNLKSKDEIIDKINEEIQLIKLEKENVKQEFISFKQNLERKIVEIDDKMKSEENESFNRKTKQIFADIQKENEQQIELFNNETKSIKLVMMETNKKSEMMETRINELKEMIDCLEHGRFEWTIDNLDEKRKVGKYIDSECFWLKMKQYKLQLQFHPNGGYDIKGKGFSVFVRVHSGPNDSCLPWPFTADVTIKVISKTNSNINKSITKHCKIDKPPENSWRWSDAFDYLNCDLIKDGEMLDNSFMFQCFFNFK